MKQNKKPCIALRVIYIFLSVVILLGIIETIVYLSLVVRRIHDTNHSAWKGFFRPAICCIVVYFCALLYLSFVINGKNIFELDSSLENIRFVVNKKNPYFAEYMGSLYTKDFETLLFPSFQIPEMPPQSRHRLPQTDILHEKSP